MGRFLKNPDLAPGAYASRLPIVNSYTANADAATSGLIRFNSVTNRIEFYYNGAWNQVAKIGTVQLVVDDITTYGTNNVNGTNAVFSMSQAETDPTAIAVFIDGIYQQPTLHYTVSGTLITFASAPPAAANGSQIVVIHNINSTNVPA
jgi:hypothetical protein